MVSEKKIFEKVYVADDDTDDDDDDDDADDDDDGRKVMTKAHMAF